MSELYTSTVLYHLGPVRELLEDRGVSEVMINGHDTIYCERKGRVELCPDLAFDDADALMAACVNIAQFSGKQLSQEHPRYDGRLPDGSRVHVVIPPIAPMISVAIRRFQTVDLSIAELIKINAITPEAARLLDTAIQIKRNIVISGGTGSGKTTLLSVLCDYLREEERIVVIEDTREIQLRKPHKVQLEARPPDKYGRGQVTIRDLIHSTLRLRPDRIIVGEVRGGEALDLLTALNSGHGGTLTTVHADSAGQSLSKLETLVLFAGEEMPMRAIRAQICSSVDLVVQTSRFRDGTRKIKQIAEVLHQLDDAGNYQVRSLFRFKHRGLGPTGEVIGRLTPTGTLPSFFEDAVDQGFLLRRSDFGLEPGPEEEVEETAQFGGGDDDTLGAEFSFHFNDEDAEDEPTA